MELSSLLFHLYAYLCLPFQKFFGQQSAAGAAATVPRPPSDTGQLQMVGESTTGGRRHSVAPSLSSACAVCTRHITHYQPYWWSCCNTHVCIPR